MLDLVNFKSNEKYNRKFKANFRNENYTDITAEIDYTANDEIFKNPGLNGDRLLIYHGLVLKDNIFDCFSFSATFTEKKEDMLTNQRKDFFAKFFMYDRSHQDLMYR